VRIISIAKCSLVFWKDFLSCEVVIPAFFYSFHPLVRWHISNGRQLMILLTIHLIFVHFSAKMITFTYMIVRYGPYNDLFLFLIAFAFINAIFQLSHLGSCRGTQKPRLRCCKINLALIIQQFLLTKFLAIDVILTNLFLIFFGTADTDFSIWFFVLR